MTTDETQVNGCRTENSGAAEAPQGAATCKPQPALEVTDADYRSIFLPCEALEEKEERPG